MVAWLRILCVARGSGYGVSEDRGIPGGWRSSICCRCTGRRAIRWPGWPSCSIQLSRSYDVAIAWLKSQAQEKEHFAAKRVRLRQAMC